MPLNVLSYNNKALIELPCINGEHMVIAADIPVLLRSTFFKSRSSVRHHCLYGLVVLNVDFSAKIKRINSKDGIVWNGNS